MLRNLMNRIRMNRIKKKKGFTLIELIIVIVIIAIIAAFAIPNFLKVQENAKKDADVNLGRTIAHAVETMTTEGTIQKPVPTGQATTATKVITIIAPAATNGNADEALKIEEYVKTGTLKLQTKGAKFPIKVTINEEGKVTKITDNTEENVMYDTDDTTGPGGIFAK